MIREQSEICVFRLGKISHEKTFKRFSWRFKSFSYLLELFSKPSYKKPVLYYKISVTREERQGECKSMEVMDLWGRLLLLADRKPIRAVSFTANLAATNGSAGLLDPKLWWHQEAEEVDYLGLIQTSLSLTWNCFYEITLSFSLRPEW